MDTAAAAKMSKGLKAVSDVNRIRILAILVTGEYCVSDLVDKLEIDQPKVSHHLAILKQAGIIRNRRQGRHINYSIEESVHRREEHADGPTDIFDLKTLSVSFRFRAAEPPVPTPDGHRIIDPRRVTAATGDVPGRNHEGAAGV